MSTPASPILEAVAGDAAAPAPALRLLGAARRLVHRRYVRGVVAAAALVVTGLASVVPTLQWQAGTSRGAVLRYLFRPHAGEIDMAKLLRDPATSLALARLMNQGALASPGGLAYADAGALRFYPWVGEELAAGLADRRAGDRLYPELLAHYLAGRLGELAAALDRPAAAALLASRPGGAAAHARLRASNRAGGEPGPGSWRTARSLVRLFAPGEGLDFRLSLADKLRFYEQARPAGRFLGAFELLAAPLAGPLDDAYYHSLSRHAHYLVVARRIDGLLTVSDFYRGQRRTYLLLPVKLFGDRTFFRLALPETA